MFKKSIVSSIIFALSLFCIFSACKKEQPDKACDIKKILVATDATWPPMEFVDEKTKEIVGFDIDMLKAIAAEGGFEVEIMNQAWDGIFAGLGAGKYDAVISSVTITKDRKKTMDFSMPYVSVGQILVVKKDSDVTNLSQLEGKTVGAQISTTGALEVRKNKKINAKEYDEIGFAIEDLANGRIDAVVCDNPTAANYVLENQKYKAILKMAGERFTDEQYGIAVKKGNKELVELLNNGIKKVLEKGLDKEFEKKWLQF